MKASELVQDVMHLNFLLSRHGSAHLFVRREAVLLHLTELRHKPEMAGNAFCHTIDAVLSSEVETEPSFVVALEVGGPVWDLVRWLQDPSQDFELLPSRPGRQTLEFLSPVFEGRRYRFHIVGIHLTRVPSMVASIPFEGVPRSARVASVASMVSATLLGILLPDHSAAHRTHGAALGRTRTLLLAQDATRSAGDGPLPRHDLFGLSGREWAHQVPRDVTKDEYVACAERVHEAARTDGFKALAEELAQREHNPGQEAPAAREWVVALKLLAALFAEPWGSFSEVTSNPHTVRSRHSDPLIRRPSV
ncbi:hypothetical protein JCM9279_006175 [Rhodotorula babjevae]